MPHIPVPASVPTATVLLLPLTASCPEVCVPGSPTAPDPLSSLLSECSCCIHVFWWFLRRLCLLLIHSHFPVEKLQPEPALRSPCHLPPSAVIALGDWSPQLQQDRCVSRARAASRNCSQCLLTVNAPWSPLQSSSSLRPNSNAPSSRKPSSAA